jgi:AcrR family transcriptional regulator
VKSPDHEPVSRRDRPPRPALSRSAIVEAGLAVAAAEGLDAVTMRRVATHLDTSASALYVYIEHRDDLLESMFDHVMSEVAAPARGDWRERLATLLLRAITAASGHGGLARVALTTIPDGPNATAITAQVRGLLTEAGLADAAIPGALDLLALFVTGAALDRVPATVSSPHQHQQHLRWEIDVILNGLTATPPPAGPKT